MAETTEFTIEGSMELAYYADQKYSKRVLIHPEEEGDFSPESVETKIATSLNFPNDQEFDAIFAKMEELRKQGLRTEEGVPDGTREVQLRITVEVL